MRLIVDVMNVLHVWRDGPEGGKAADVLALARAIRRSRFSGAEVVLVCDGTPPPGIETEEGSYEAEGCRVLFSGPGAEADDVIEGLIAGDGPVRETVVVSADRRLGRAARARGARSTGSRTFVGVLVEDGRRAGTPGAGGAGADHAEGALESTDVEAWLEEFGLESEPRSLGRGGEGGVAPALGGSDVGGTDCPIPRPGEPIADDWLAEAGREWRISEEELDMERWLDEEGEGGPGKT